MNAFDVKARMQWMDGLRGIAIILVIVWHSVSLAEKGGVEVPDWTIRANYFFLPYRMPALMFLSGLLLASSLRKPAYLYYVGKVRLLVWPYIIWASIYLLVIGSEYPIYSARAWFPLGHLWFLAFITAYYFIAPLIKWIPVWIIPVVLLVASIPIDSVENGVVKKVLYFGTFFYLGHVASVYRGFLERLLSSRWMTVVLLVAVAFGIYAVFEDVERQWQYVPLNVLGIVASIWLVRRVENHRAMKPLKYLGRQSLIFYVSHVPAIAIVLGISESLRLNSPAVLIPASIIVALLCGYILTRVGSTILGRWFFSIPQTRAAPRGKSTSIR